MQEQLVEPDASSFVNTILGEFNNRLSDPAKYKSMTPARSHKREEFTVQIWQLGLICKSLCAKKFIFDRKMTEFTRFVMLLSQSIQELDKGVSKVIGLETLPPVINLLTRYGYTLKMSSQKTLDSYITSQINRGVRLGYNPNYRLILSLAPHDGISNDTLDALT